MFVYPVPCQSMPTQPWPQSHYTSWKSEQNWILPAYKKASHADGKRRQTRETITSLLLPSLSVIASYLVPFSLCALILPGTDADQMEDWKMKGATDEEEGRKEKKMGRRKPKGETVWKRCFVPFMIENWDQLGCEWDKNTLCLTNARYQVPNK